VPEPPASEIVTSPVALLWPPTSRVLALIFTVLLLGSADSIFTGQDELHAHRAHLDLDLGLQSGPSADATRAPGTHRTSWLRALMTLLA
jgi:hypothetical protein